MSRAGNGLGCSKTIYMADVIVPYTATHLITRTDRFISRVEQDLTSPASIQPLKPSSWTVLSAGEGHS
jgi:hypothetical protein